MGYLYLLISIVTEVLATNLLKATDGFTKLNMSIFCIISYIVCFYSLSQSLKYIPLNIAYALWGALGIILITAISIFFWKESVNIQTIIGIIFLIVGTVLINIYGSSH